jgi:hypothetical protein
MPIVLRASTADNNPGGAPPSFIGFSRPSGVSNGDTIIVGIAASSVGIIVTPPSVDWIPIAQTDPAQAIIVLAFYKTALNEPTHWVFELDSAVQASGVALVYGGVDSFTAVEAVSAALSAASTTHNIAAATASLPQEEEVLLLGAAAPGTYVPTGGFLTVANRSRTGSAIEAQRHQLQNAGAQPAFTEEFSDSVAGASLRIILRPSFGTLTVDDVYRRLVAALPGGVEDVYDLTKSGDYYRFYQVIAAALKTYSYDQIDLLRREIVPQLAQYKLPDWERVFGVETTQAAQLGTVPERQAQIVGAWRAAAGQGSSIPVVQAVLGPLLGYNADTPVEVLECDRAALKASHTYSTLADISLVAGATESVGIPVHLDGGTVAAMGAQLTLNFATAPTSGYSIKLTAPDGKSRTWTGTWAATTVILYGPELAGARINGTWTLAVTRSAGGGANTLVAGAQLFVEGIARGQETAGAIFTWAVYADPAHVGESGTPANFDAAQAAIDHIAFAYTRGFLVISLAPWPDVVSGPNAAIPDRCLPV